MVSIKQDHSGQPQDAREEFLTLLIGFKKVITSDIHVEPHLNGISVCTEGLTRREMQVLRLVAFGNNNSEIARQLFISVNTVTRHMTNIFLKTGTTNRVEAAVYASRHGIM